ncbi:MAG: 1-deoxy-D-xylulose-5-phosphate reductoisomerase, partial [Thermomicrobiales bacterium]
SAADEEAVMAFLHGKIAFIAIPALLEATLAAYSESVAVTVENIEAADRWARAEAQAYVAAHARHS